VSGLNKSEKREKMQKILAEIRSLVCHQDDSSSSSMIDAVYKEPDAVKHSSLQVLSQALEILRRKKLSEKVIKTNFVDNQKIDNILVQKRFMDMDRVLFKV